MGGIDTLETRPLLDRTAASSEHLLKELLTIEARLTTYLERICGDDTSEELELAPMRSGLAHVTEANLNRSHGVVASIHRKLAHLEQNL